MEFTWHGRTSGNIVHPRRIDNYSFIYVESGNGVFKTGGDSYPIEPDDLYILFPQEVHEYYPDPGRPWTLLWFGIIGKDMPSLMDKAGIHKESPVVKSVKNHAIPELFSDIIRLLNDNSIGKNIFALGKFMTLLGHLYNCHEGRPDSGSSPDYRIQQAIRFMEYNFFFDIDSNTLADIAGYTRTYFSALFKEMTGKSPMEYLIEIRLEKACRLLKETTLPINEISNSSGYSDPFYFTKAFKKRYGLNPSQFRRNTSFSDH